MWGEGVNGLPVHVIRSADGCSAEVYEHGSSCTSWKSDQGEELLFLSSLAKFEPPTAIRGGIPVCWPQFGDLGPIKAQHGFARNVVWSVAAGIGGSADSVTLVLQPSDATRQQYPHEFEVTLQTRVGDNSLTQELVVTNKGTSPMPFTCALHTYFRVSDATQAAVVGLKGCRYLDSLAQRAERVEEGEEVRFGGEVDRIYLQAPDVLKLVDEARGSAFLIRKHGFQDAVVWNPWVEKAQRMADFPDEGYKEMVCVEVAQAGSGPVTLQPGEAWRAGQTLEFTKLD